MPEGLIKNEKKMNYLKKLLKTVIRSIKQANKATT